MAALASVVVVGASLAGLRCAEALRRLGFEGRLALVGEEPHRPYDRPPLSKEILRGEREPEAIALTGPERFDALELDLHLGRRAVALDPAARQVTLEGGGSLRFDGLVIATGARPRRLPGQPDLRGVFALRTLDDALAIRDALARRPRVAVVGAGFSGAEVAASCRALGLDVTMIEPLPAPLAAALPAWLGEVCAAAHRDHGVDLRLGARVEAFEGGDRLERLRLSDGAVVAADVAVVGVGVTPCTEWLQSSGLPVEDGVVCDETSAVADGIVAAGDVARWHNPLFAVSMRVEHWTNAVEQATAAAERLLAGSQGGAPYAPAPFVWSDQYDLKIQSTGQIGADDETRVVHGTLAERRFVVLFGRKGRLTGAVAFNRVRQLMRYRRMIREGATWDAALAAAQE
jgi:NADPH-dependent 2,4-dienoyl-CoA reductase/sulfur reductase-like enzyme